MWPLALSADPCPPQSSSFYFKDPWHPLPKSMISLSPHPVTSDLQGQLLCYRPLVAPSLRPAALSAFPVPGAAPCVHSCCQTEVFPRPFLFFLCHPLSGPNMDLIPYLTHHSPQSSLTVHGAQLPSSSQFKKPITTCSLDPSTRNYLPMRNSPVTPYNTQINQQSRP